MIWWILLIGSSIAAERVAGKSGVFAVMLLGLLKVVFYLAFHEMAEQSSSNKFKEIDINGTTLSTDEIPYRTLVRLGSWVAAIVATALIGIMTNGFSS